MRVVNPTLEESFQSMKKVSEFFSFIFLICQFKIM